MLNRRMSHLGSQQGGGAEAPLESDRPPAGFLLVLMILLTIILFVVGFIGVEILRRMNESNLSAGFQQRAYSELIEQRALDSKRLSEYDRAQDGVHFMVPIGVAKEELLRRASTAPLR